MDENALKCQIHTTTYKTISDFLEHKVECNELLIPNICLYNIYGGKSCKKTFKETGSLIAHYLLEHQQFACSSCFAVFDTIQDLEKHAHTDEFNLRLSKWKSQQHNKNFYFLF